MGFTCALPVTSKAVVSYTAFPPLHGFHHAVYFCCTFPGVAPARRYLAPCPVKPGLSSPVSATAATICPTQSPIIISQIPLSVQQAISRSRLPDGKRTLQSGAMPLTKPAAVSLYPQAASADELPDNRILRDIFAADSEEIVEEFQKTLGLVVVLGIPWDMEQKRLRIKL